MAAHAEPRTDVPRPAAGNGARGLASAGVLLGAAGIAMNGLAALVPLAAARPLPPDEFGALSALLAVGTVVAVVGIALQMALAVRWARHERVEDADRVSLRTAGIATGALVVATPILAVALDLHPVQSLLLAMMTFPVIVAGRWLGELQGRQQFGRLAGAMALLGLGRYGGLLVALVSGLGVTASLVVGVVTTPAARRQPRSPSPTPTSSWPERCCRPTTPAPTRSARCSPGARSGHLPC
jgi:O-antigen/teichoic acid export membrane protein